jgi:hypothetical protein
MTRTSRPTSRAQSALLLTIPILLAAACGGPISPPTAAID